VKCGLWKRKVASLSDPRQFQAARIFQTMIQGRLLTRLAEEIKGTPAWSVGAGRGEVKNQTEEGKENRIYATEEKTIQYE